MQQSVTEERTENRWNFTTMLDDLNFADDIALLSSINNEPSPVQDTKLEDNSAKKGVRLNANKCKRAESEQQERNQTGDRK